MGETLKKGKYCILNVCELPNFVFVKSVYVIGTEHVYEHQYKRDQKE